MKSFASFCDQGKSVGVIFLDFSNVYDTDFHSLLLDGMSSIQLERHDARGEQLAAGLGPKGYSKWVTSGW